ncbi:hypothetical protein UFOVP540_12 [uncultured Caudovirales phage]|jgi:hypothetical protein|uniref:Tail tube protein n=1 Tax=uncultured Caudovirales phage TaxID=2100421 RepID=A0A6J5MW77_9CAUD|nr:hypothetical protein UFOVP540_12 [uncultured Caudovirales phage]
MAQGIVNKVGFKVGAADPASIDLSAYVTSFTLTRSVDQIETTAMGDTGHRYVAGLENNQLVVELINDDAATAVLQTMNTLFKSNAYFKCALDKSSTGSAANPFYTGLILVDSITPIAGDVASLGMQSLTFQVSGAITVLTTGTF